MMKRMIALLLAGALIAAVGYVAGLHAAQRGHPPPLAHLQDSAWLQQHLGLTASQVEMLQTIEKDYNVRLLSLCEEHCSARNDLAAQLLRADWSAEAEQDMLERMGRAQVKTDAVTLDHIRQVRRTLTPEQRARYDQYVAVRLQTACPHHLHHGTMAHTDGVH
jgi:Spy/CpxP family protein refolding chaperone